MKLYPAASLPAIFDIVICNFPLAEEPGKPGPKGRPCLVVKTAETLGDEELPHVRVLYGTSNPKFGKRPYDFFVCNMTEMEEAGLFYPTRFDMDNRLWLPWSPDYFTPAEGYSCPRIGHLSKNCQGSFWALIQRRARQGLE